jgi:hypothetical protein
MSGNSKKVLGRIQLSDAQGFLAIAEKIRRSYVEDRFAKGHCYPGGFAICVSGSGYKSTIVGEEKS